MWATWCAPCRATIPHLDKLALAFPDDVVVIGVSKESKSTIEKFLVSNKIHYPMVAAPRGMTKPFSLVTTIPTIFVIRRDGTLAQTLVGSHSFNQLAQAFRSADSPAAPAR